MYFSCGSFLFFVFWLLASWLLGFSASWLFGFLFVYAAFGRFFCFGFSHPLHSQLLFGRWRFCICGFSLVHAAFGGFGFWRLLLFVSSAFPVPLRHFGFCTVSLDLASHIVSITSSSLKKPPPPTHRLLIAPLFKSTVLQTSSGGLPPPPQNPPVLFRFLAEI